MTSSLLSLLVAPWTSNSTCNYGSPAPGTYWIYLRAYEDSKN
jgi:hypothetical protein